jgi:hypothetical protein
MFSTLGYSLRPAINAALLAAVLALASPTQPVPAAQGDCGQPASGGTSPTATDALFALNAAVGLVACNIDVCDADGNCTVTAIDALRILKIAVGEILSLDCDNCSTTTTTLHDGSNRAPIIEAVAPYRLYPGYAMALPIVANDPDDDGLSFSATNLPAGCTIDSDTGLLEWIPDPDQLGPFYIQVSVTDDGEPPLSADALVATQVSVPDQCNQPVCDPATGCTDVLSDIEIDCCSGEPTDRVGEVIAGCDEGLIAFVGRNSVGFGRVQNCDLLHVLSFAQGGFNLSINVEARCLNIDHAVDIRVRLETAQRLLINRGISTLLQPREDGFDQKLSLFYGMPTSVAPEDIHGVEADLVVTLTDADDVSVVERLRVVLTLDEVDDLPNPDVDEVEPSEAGCVGCHRPLVGGGERVGIEDAHPPVALSCTDCHGGDPGASTRAEAHVSPGGGAAYLRNLTSDELDSVDPAYLRFVNPGDLRIADQTCGQFGCHPEHVENVKLSTMSTYGGHYTLPRYLAGIQTRAAEVAAVDVVDSDFNLMTAPDGAVESLAALREPDESVPRDDMESLIDTYLPKSCPTCHLNAFGRNQAPGTYRSSGCTACHMLYNDDGLSKSADPVISESFPPHPVRHELITAMPVEQCAHCHFQGGRIGLAYRGIREGGFDPAHTPPNAVPLDTPLYGHDADFYFTDEDSTNSVDETPPDLHYSAGMACIDCHIGGDVHGDGNLYSAERYQVGIRCEDCHGTVRSEITEDPGDGFFKNSQGFALKRVTRDLDDRIMLDLALEDRQLEIPQIKRILDSGANPFMNAAMGIYGNGFSHTDSLECYTCHTAWRQNCFGCHVTVDDSRSARNETTGETSIGAITASRDNYSIDFFALGEDRNGKLAPLCSSMSLLMSYVDADGTLQYEDVIRTSGDGRKGFGWNPFHHHTVSRIPQNCDSCHPVVPGSAPDNSAQLNETYGFGNGQITVTDGSGETHDLTRLLDDDGNLISDFPHPDTGPVPVDKRDRALAIEVIPQPR